MAQAAPGAPPPAVPPGARPLDWPACYNARDLGGHITGDGGRIRPRAIVRSDCLSRLTADGRWIVRSFGARTVVDLRSRAEIALDPSPFAADAEIGYVHVPIIDDATGIEITATRAARSAREIFLHMLVRSRGSMARVMRAVARAPRGAVVIHCHAGKDRTGFVVAMLLALAGVPQDAIAADYATSDRYLTPLFERKTARLAPDERLRAAWAMRSDPHTVLEALDVVERDHGGVEAYLRASGVMKEHIRSIRGRLLEPHA